MKLTLIDEAPCEIIETLIRSMLEKIREATPGVNFRFSPTRQINAASRSTETSPRDCRSAAIASRRRVSSIVIETLTSEVATMSTEVSRSEEHTSELQSLRHLVCRLLLEKKK